MTEQRIPRHWWRWGPWMDTTELFTWWEANPILGKLERSPEVEVQMYYSGARVDGGWWVALDPHNVPPRFLELLPTERRQDSGR